MSKVTAEFKNEFEAKLFELFPDVQTTGRVKNGELLEVMSALDTKTSPRWLMQNRVSRGVYAFPVAGATALKPVEDEPVKESYKVDYADTTSLIPDVDPNFVPFGNYRDLDKIIKSQLFYPAFITGPTGNGKSTMIEQICAKQKKALIRVNLNMMTDEDQLIGSKTLTDGNIEIVEGPVLIAMRTGTTLLLDEIDAGSANTLLCLQPILEGKPYYFKLKNEMIVPKQGFNIIATANTKGKGSDDGRYIGTNVLNEAFLERFAVTFEQDYPSARYEKKIIENLMAVYNCSDELFASNLVKWAEAIRRTFDDGGVDETITTRRMTHIIRAYSVFGDQAKAIELCVNRFDTATKLAFIDLFDKVAGGELEEPSDESVENSAPHDGVPF
jgi:hypothetical protein